MRFDPSSSYHQLGGSSPSLKRLNLVFPLNSWVKIITFHSSCQNLMIIFKSFIIRIYNNSEKIFSLRYQLYGFAFFHVSKCPVGYSACFSISSRALTCHCGRSGNLDNMSEFFYSKVFLLVFKNCWKSESNSNPPTLKNHFGKKASCSP